MPAAPTSSKSSVPMASFCRSKPTPMRGAQSFVPRTLPSPRPNSCSNGRMNPPQALGQHRSAPSADQHLRSPRCVLAQASGRLDADLGRDGRGAYSYCADMGFTHIEFLPVTEHPYDPLGVTRRPAFMHRPPASASRKGLPASSMAPTRSASASFSTGCPLTSRPTSMV